MKVYDLSKRRLLLEKRWPRYLYYDEIQGRKLQGVSKGSIHDVHRPEQRLVALLHARRKDRLGMSAVRLIEVLAQESMLTLRCFGVSGSLLVGLHRPDSDIDVVVYGKENAARVQRTLSALLEGNERFHRYRTRDLKRLYVKRSLQQAMSFRDFEMHERRKVLQGKFLCHDYFIRCVSDWTEISERYGETRYVPMGNCTISAHVVDDTEGLLTPCRYVLGRVQVLTGAVSHKPREIVSFRGRFAEQARRGERVIARGRLEGVRSEESRFFRLVIGEDRTDALRTVG